jgi:hypothetical protein
MNMSVENDSLLIKKGSKTLQCRVLSSAKCPGDLAVSVFIAAIGTLRALMLL